MSDFPRHVAQIVRSLSELSVDDGEVEILLSADAFDRLLSAAHEWSVITGIEGNMLRVDDEKIAYHKPTQFQFMGVRFRLGEARYDR